jgi:hypothetical protein
MDAVIEAELQELERLSQQAARNERLPQDVRDHLVGYAYGTLATLLHPGLVTRQKDAEWRERLRPALGDALRRSRFRIVRDDGLATPPPPLTAEEKARRAYAVCRDLSLTKLAWSLHTGASEHAVVEALAVDAGDAERVRRPCGLGFADRGKRVVEPHDL